MSSKEIIIKEIQSSDKVWITSLLVKQWGSTLIVSRGRIHDATIIPGFIAFKEEKPVGLITYVIENGECEIITLNSLLEHQGIGTYLVERVEDVAKEKQCKRLWLIETNDNTAALCFYQKRGFQLAALHKNAIKTSRKLKPQIPFIGRDGIPIRDELELEIKL